MKLSSRQNVSLEPARRRGLRALAAFNSLIPMGADRSSGETDSLS